SWIAIRASGDPSQTAEGVPQLAGGRAQPETRNAHARARQAVDVDANDCALAQRQLTLAYTEHRQQLLELTLVSDECDAVVIGRLGRQRAPERARRRAGGQFLEREDVGLIHRRLADARRGAPSAQSARNVEIDAIAAHGAHPLVVPDLVVRSLHPLDAVGEREVRSTPRTLGGDEGWFLLRPGFGGTAWSDLFHFRPPGV